MNKHSVETWLPLYLNSSPVLNPKFQEKDKLKKVRSIWNNCMDTQYLKMRAVLNNPHASAIILDCFLSSHGYGMDHVPKEFYDEMKTFFISNKKMIETTKYGPDILNKIQNMTAFLPI